MFHSCRKEKRGTTTIHFTKKGGKRKRKNNDDACHQIEKNLPLKVAAGVTTRREKKVKNSTPPPSSPKKPQEKKEKEKGICLRPHISAVSWLLLTLFKTFFLGGNHFFFFLFREMEGGNFRFGTFINHQKGGGGGEIFCALPLPPLFSQIKMNWRTRRKNGENKSGTDIFGTMPVQRAFLLSVK